MGGCCFCIHTTQLHAVVTWLTITLTQLSLWTVWAVTPQCLLQNTMIKMEPTRKVEDKGGSVAERSKVSNLGSNGCEFEPRARTSVLR